jgi:hypothetical protein
MKYFYDTEFLEDGRTIELISIGIVSQDGREYYAINRDAPWDRIQKDEWLMKNVVPSLDVFTLEGSFQQYRTTPKKDIAAQVHEFITRWVSNPIELWADYAAYDHVALCQLWGRMVDLPTGVSMFTNDIQQEAARLGLDGRLPTSAGVEHNALDDARLTKLRWEYLEQQQLDYYDND